MTRPDRRTENTQLRTFSATQNVLHRADGSARFDLGTNKREKDMIIDFNFF